MPFPIVPVIAAVAGVIEKILPDPQKAAEAKIRMFELMQQGELADLEANLKVALAQLDVNKEEAKTPGIFRGGWRPFVGWTCGMAFAWNFVGLPIGAFAARVWLDYSGEFPPPLELTVMMPVLLGMLGLGGMRTFERVQGKA